MKVGLVLKRIGEPCLGIYSNFTFLPEHDDPAGGEDKLSAEHPGSNVTVMAKFDEIKKRDSQLMLQGKNLTSPSPETLRGGSRPFT